MFSSAKVDITTDSSGDATVYIEPSINNKLNGFLVLLKYSPGTIDTLADLTITGETSGMPIMSKTDAGTAITFYFPRAFPNAVSGGAAGTVASEMLPIKNERIKVVVAQGGASKTGSIEALVYSPPY